MGTHPIFESDFDCLTEWAVTASITMVTKTVKTNTIGSQRIMSHQSSGQTQSIPLKTTINNLISNHMVLCGVLTFGTCMEQKVQSRELQLLPDSNVEELDN